MTSQSETLSILVVQALSYYYRGNIITSDIKIRQAMSALKLSQKLARMEQN